MLKHKWAVLYTLRCLRDRDASHSSGFSAPSITPSMGALQLLPAPRDEPRAAAAQPVVPAGARNGHTALTRSRNEHGLSSEMEQLVAENTSFEVPELRLLRDVIYALQGVDGRYIKYDSQRDCYSVVPEVGVPAATRDLIRRICELGWMYRRVCGYVNATLDSKTVGLVEQSFCGALQTELTDYYRLVAVLETQLLGSGASSSADDAVAVERHFTLRRLFVWVQDPMERLRVMAMLCDAAKGLKGGALSSAIGAHLRHGDPFMQGFVRRTMNLLCTPLFEMIRKWVATGELQDPFEEFFVASDPSVPKDRLWQDKYSLRKAMVPSFIGEQLALKILVTGKTINFIRLCCKDSKWIAACTINMDAFEFGEDAAWTQLERAVDEAAQVTNAHAMELLKNKYGLSEHCNALKKYLLLGQGDFVQHLLDLLLKELDRPAKVHSQLSS